MTLCVVTGKIINSTSGTEVASPKLGLVVEDKLSEHSCTSVLVLDFPLTYFDALQLID